MLLNGMAPIVRTILLVGVVEGVEVVVTEAVAVKYISDEFQDPKLSDTSPSNKKDGL
jgi:hypothetical protein